MRRARGWIRREPLSRELSGAEDLGEFTLHVPGVHNILNATAAIAVGVGLDMHVDDDSHRARSIPRGGPEISVAGAGGGVSVIDDYGHHPTEIRRRWRRRNSAALAGSRDLSAAPVHAHAGFDGGVYHGVWRRGFAACAGYLCGERAADRRHQRGSAGAGDSRERVDAERGVCGFVRRCGECGLRRGCEMAI
jgi:hypothetical protein